MGMVLTNILTKSAQAARDASLQIHVPLETHCVSYYKSTRHIGRTPYIFLCLSQVFRLISTGGIKLEVHVNKSIFFTFLKL